MNQLEEYIWENIPVSLSEDDRLENTPNYKIYRFVIEAIKHFGNSPQHKEIVYEIDFDGSCKAMIAVTENKVKIIKAMNGYGYNILLNDISISVTK